MIITLGLIILIIAADRLVKLWAVTVLRNGDLPGIDGIFHFTYIENTGAAFSILEKHTWILIVISAVVSLAALYVLFIRKVNPAYSVCLAFIAAGGIGNLIDRIAYGYVVDMFELDFIRFGIFNVADMFITVGGILLMVVYIFFDKDKQPEKKTAAVVADETTGADDNAGAGGAAG